MSARLERRLRRKGVAVYDGSSDYNFGSDWRVINENTGDLDTFDIADRVRQ